ncbi:MAG: hypothetical protein NT069_23540 [Planctomycetota bacterium]|nr:hypothetical protein [Planctomycetota bacterium]
MLFRIYIGLGVLITALYVTAAITGVRGPQFASGASHGSQSGGGFGGGYFGGRSAGGSSSTWHGGK